MQNNNINMRKLFILIFLIVSTITMAQEKRVYLFQEFAKTIIKYKANQRFSVMANFDVANQKVMYKQGEDLMELVNPALVDTIFFGNQKWIYHNDQYCQIAKMPKGEILIAWHITKVHDGYVGVYGTSQVPSHKIQLEGNFGMGTIAGISGGMYNGSFGTNTNDGQGRNLDVWKNKNQNTYYFTKNGKEYKLTSLKSVYKTFPDQKAKIQEYVKENSLDMMSAEKALQIVDFCLGLE